MNISLTEEIIKHILSNLSIHDNLSLSSLKNDIYLLPLKLKFQLEDNKNIENNIWGCQINIGNQLLKIILGDTSSESDFSEYCLIVHLEGSPYYGLYLSFDVNQSQAMIACSINGTDWMLCDIYLQATFLAAMEKLKEKFLSQSQCTSFKNEHQAMLNFIKYHTSMHEEDYEREEN